RVLSRAPREFLPRGTIGLGEHARSMTKHVVRELAPHDLVRVLREHARRVPDGADAERAELEVLRDAARPVDVETIAIELIAIGGATEELREARLRCALAARRQAIVLRDAEVF